MSPVTAPTADRRFRRAHVKPARRRTLWRAVALPALRYALIALAVVYAAYRGSLIVLHAHLLQVDRIVITGNERLSKDDVAALLPGLRGESLLSTDLDGWRQRLLSSPWIQDAALRRSLPSTVEVAVSEHQPLGVGRVGTDLYLMDERGAVIDRYGPQYSDLDLPIIDGFAARPDADEARAELAARVIAAVHAKPAIAQRLSQVDVRDPHNAAVILSGDPAVIELGEDQFLQRLDSYLQLASALRDRVADIDYVDLRFDDRIYVKPAGAPSLRRKAAEAMTAARPAAAAPAKRKKR